MRASLTGFPRICHAIFKERLNSYGFERRSQEADESLANVIYVRQREGATPLWIGVFATLHQRDVHHFAYILLGEGSTEMPERDFDSISIWHLMKRVRPGWKPSPDDAYLLPNVEELPNALERAASDLFTYGTSFLNGDLEAFKAARAEMNRERGPFPYRVYGPPGSASSEERARRIMIEAEEFRRKYSE